MLGGAASIEHVTVTLSAATLGPVCVRVCVRTCVRVFVCAAHVRRCDSDAECGNTGPGVCAYVRAYVRARVCVRSVCAERVCAGLCAQRMCADVTVMLSAATLGPVCVRMCMRVFVCAAHVRSVCVCLCVRARRCVHSARACAYAYLHACVPDSVPDPDPNCR